MTPAERDRSASAPAGEEPANWRNDTGTIRALYGDLSVMIPFKAFRTLEQLLDAVAALHSRSPEKPSEKPVAWWRGIRNDAGAEWRELVGHPDAAVVGLPIVGGDRYHTGTVISVTPLYLHPSGKAVTRLEVIDHRTGSHIEQGRAFVAHDCAIELGYQDSDRTLKVFVTDPSAPSSPEKE